MQWNNQKVYFYVNGLTKYEQQLNCNDIITVDQNKVNIQTKNGMKQFKCQNSTKNQILQVNTNDLPLDSWFISFGATGTGKTRVLFQEGGIVEQIFIQLIQQFQSPIKINLLEIHNNKIIDLISGNECQLVSSQQSFNCQQMTTIEAQNIQEIQKIIQDGLKKKYNFKYSMTSICTYNPTILKLQVNEYSVQFCECVGFQQLLNCTQKEMIASVNYANLAFSQIEQILSQSNESQRMLNCNQTLLTKLLKNAFKNQSYLNLIPCISASSEREKETNRTLGIIEKLNQ